MEKEETFKCDNCEKEFKTKESVEMHNKAKHSQKPEKSEKRRQNLSMKKSKTYLIAMIIFGLIVFGVVWTISSIEVLPPTDMQGHVEKNPLSHVLKEPMPIAVQKHMLEHADGTGRPGVIINYNCEDYECESDLIESLEEFASYYDYVYIAPFKNMDAKIALTKLGKIEILEFYDWVKIHTFISGRVPTNEELGITGSSIEEQEKIQEDSTQETIKEFSLTARQWQFSPDTIEVNKGDNVILNIKSMDVTHGFSIREFGINERLTPGSEVKIEFLADKKGTFSFFCSIQCGIGHTGMKGVLIVK